MPHIHTEPGQHDQTASAFVIRTDTPEPRILLHMHKKLGVLMEPGGHVELNETPWQAVLHEVLEESGYMVEQLQVLQPVLRLKSLAGAVLHPVPVVLNTHKVDVAGNHKHSDIEFAFIVQTNPAQGPAEGESRDLRWLSLAELNDLSQDEIFSDVREVCQFVLTDILPNWETVPATEFAR